MPINRSTNYLVLAFMLGATSLFATEPAELTSLRARRDEAVAKVQQDAQAQVTRINEQYAQMLDSLMKQFTLDGNLDAALAVREEKNGKIPQLGQDQVSLPVSTLSGSQPAAEKAPIKKTPLPSFKNVRVPGNKRPGYDLGKVSAGDKILVQYVSGMYSHRGNPLKSPDETVEVRTSIVVKMGDDYSTLVEIPTSTKTQPFEYTFDTDYKSVGLTSSEAPWAMTGEVSYKIAVIKSK